MLYTILLTDKRLALLHGLIDWYGRRSNFLQLNLQFLRRMGNKCMSRMIFQLSVNKAFQNQSSAFAWIAKLELSPIFAESRILYRARGATLKVGGG